MIWNLDLKSFKRIYDYEQRKGNNIDKLFDDSKFQTLIDFSTNLENFLHNPGGVKYRKKEFLKFSNSMCVEKEYKGFHDEILNIISFDSISKKNEKRIKLLLRDWKKHYVDTILESFTDTKDLHISKGRIINGKQVYCIGGDARSFFVSKVIQHKLNQVYGLSMSNRNRISSQLANILGDWYPKIVIRADVKQFYESIDFGKIISTMANDKMLPKQMISILKSINYHYKKLSGQTIGIPRGIGISSCLAEYVMRDFDKSVRLMDGLLYYARFVDDIIAVFSIESKSDGILEDTTQLAHEKIEILKEKIHELKLCFHEDSDDEKQIVPVNFPAKYSSCSSPVPGKVDFLGYCYQVVLTQSQNIAKGSPKIEKLTIDMTEAKIKRQKMKIDVAFRFYFADCRKKKPLHKRARLLYYRLRFLTDSYHLVGLKRNVVVGLPMSYPLVTDDCKCLDVLDMYLKERIGKTKLPDLMKSEFLKLSYKTGFRNKKPIRVSRSSFEEIMSCWSNE